MNILCEYVVMPTDSNVLFMKWWKSPTCDDKCNVSYPQSLDKKAIVTNLPRQEQKWIEFIALTSQAN